MALSCDGKIVATGSNDKARVWDAARGKPLSPALLHQAPVNALAFSPDGQRVLTGSGDKTARLWETHTGVPIGAPQGLAYGFSRGSVPQPGGTVEAARDSRLTIGAEGDGADGVLMKAQRLGFSFGAVVSPLVVRTVLPSGLKATSKTQRSCRGIRVEASPWARLCRLSARGCPLRVNTPLPALVDGRWS